MYEYLTLYLLKSFIKRFTVSFFNASIEKKKKKDGRS